MRKVSQRKILREKRCKDEIFPGSNGIKLKFSICKIPQIKHDFIYLQNSQAKHLCTKGIKDATFPCEKKLFCEKCITNKYFFLAYETFLCVNYKR